MNKLPVLVHLYRTTNPDDTQYKLVAQVPPDKVTFWVNRLEGRGFKVIASSEYLGSETCV